MIWIWHLTAFWTSRFLMRDQLFILLEIPRVWWVSSLLLLARCFVFHLIMMCIGVISSELILLEFCWDSSMYELFLSDLISSKPLFLEVFFPFSLFLLRLSLGLYWCELRLGSVFFPFFSLFLRLTNLHWPICKFANSFNCQLKFDIETL